jgi:hypothetical protein
MGERAQKSKVRRAEEPLAYAAPVSVKGDARSEAPSSGAGVWARVLSVCDRYAGLGFAGFAFVHCAWQAYRARTDGALPQAGFELQPAFVASALVLIWLPFAIFAGRKLRRGTWLKRAPGVSEKEHALTVLEPLSLWVVLAFVAWHVLQIAWPLLSGTFDPSDARPELVALLSSTQHGAPLLAARYVCGVGVVAFFGARQAYSALGAASPHVAVRGAVALGVLTYLLGAYAVIRCASGVILP